MSDARPKRVDMHFHVGLLGDEHPHWGRLAVAYRRRPTYRIFLLYAGIDADRVSDRTLRESALRIIERCSMDHVVCLALDPVYDDAGRRREDLSELWVDNDYVLDLRRELGSKILLGASVHPFDPHFRDRVKKYADAGAVLLKWLPSAQQFNLADPRVGRAMASLATAGRGGGPLPLLLHVGPEYAIPTTDPRSPSYDFLSWSFWDEMRNRLRRRARRWHRPDPGAIRRNLEAALASGAVVIFAHCGLPYFTAGALGRVLEHSDFPVVRRYLERSAAGATGPGRCLADVSACATPFRQEFFPEIAKLPPGSLVFGSDFPTPAFELSAGATEAVRDFKAMLEGHLERIIVPQDNLVDVNYRELYHAFPGHPMFTNFSQLLP
ncbi:MAG: hypothetical protein HY704_00940 [Gemmatimonadetes bacterium]|nr:hypothetical protein [Gemmatimonadota bacterium]